jgi:tRNA(Ile2) C34 agmatinyltransferase TiaS
MTCCTYDCTQGRDCPVRKEPACPHCRGLGYDASGYTCTCVTAAEVAKIGRKYHDREPLRGKPWRAYLRHLAKWMLIALASVLVSALVVGVLA